MATKSSSKSGAKIAAVAANGVAPRRKQEKTVSEVVTRVVRGRQEPPALTKGELWDQEDSAFFGPYFDRIAGKKA